MNEPLSTRTRNLIDFTVMAVVMGVSAGFIFSISYNQPARIDIHDLTFVMQDGQPYVRQERTVEANGPAYAVWKARVIDAGTRAELCEGNGWWPYTSGFKAPVIPFDDWAGSPGCWDSLAPGENFQLCAEYHVGDLPVEPACSISFVKPEAEE